MNVSPNPWIAATVSALCMLSAAACPAQDATQNAAQNAASGDAAASAQPARASSSSGQLLDRIVAVVNNGTVLQSNLEAETAQAVGRLREQNIPVSSLVELRSTVLDELILQELQAQRADEAGIRIADEQVNSALQEIAASNGVGFTQLPEAMAAQGVDYGEFREATRREIQRMYLRQRDVIQRINVSPRELEEYLARQKETVAPEQEYHISDILIAVGEEANVEQLAAAETKARGVTMRARSGEAFDQLAVSNSDSQTALEGGSLGWRTGANLPTFAVDVVGRLKPGEISDPIQTSTGFHVLRLNEVRGNQQKIIEQLHLRHILITTNEVQDDATVEQRLSSIRARIVVGEDFAVLAKGTSDDTGSAVEGGDLGWTSPEVFVPEFAEVAGKLQANEISRPFKSRYGWHIVQMLGRRQFDNTETEARDRALQELRASRLDEEVELWRQRLRDSAYVEIRL